MKIHKEGYKILRNQMLFIILTVFIVKSGFILNTLLALEFILLILSLNFFRIPKKIFEYKDGLIYSPCDGKVVVIEETNENEYLKDNRIQVSIFMSPFNVHNKL